MDIKIETTKTSTVLDDIAGYEEEKIEIKKLINLFANYKKYEEKGVYIPRGLIFQGPPGCGKTLFAKAFASECGVPFYSFQPESDAKETLSKLIKTFEAAKKQKTAIIYIDEIDKLTSRRYFESDAVRTLVQFLLTELDGLSTVSGLMVIASTNYYEDLPKSLLRSGRFDKKIKIDYPDLKSRIEILNHYIKKHDLFKNVNVRALAIKIRGLSGSDIKTLINNALIEYIDSNKDLTVDDFVTLINEMQFEDIGRRWNSKEVVTKVLIHEAGHSIVGYFTKGNCGSISGIKFGDSAGHTNYDEDIPEEVVTEDGESGFSGDDSFMEEQEAREAVLSATKDTLLDEIACCFGGMAAEKVFYGDFGLGCIADVNQSFNLFDIMGSNYFYGPEPVKVDEFSTKSDHVIDRYFRLRNKILEKQRRRAYRIVRANKYLIRYIVDCAINNEDTLNKKQVSEAIDTFNKNKKELVKKYKNKDLE